MDYFFEIVINSDPKIPLPVLMNSLYCKLHKVLCDLKSTDIGVSFPKVKQNLGNVLRLHGYHELLQQLQAVHWVGPMIGYCKMSEIQSVPPCVEYRTISRIQPTMSLAKLRRLQQRGSISEKDIRQYKAKMFSQGLEHPYIELQSGSNGHKHRRFISFGTLVDTPVSGIFDQFGLSKTATVPWF